MILRPFYSLNFYINGYKKSSGEQALYIHISPLMLHYFNSTIKNKKSVQFNYLVQIALHNPTNKRIDHNQMSLCNSSFFIRFILKPAIKKIEIAV